MKGLTIALLLSVLPLSAATVEEERKTLLEALTVIADQPSEMSTERYGKALKIMGACDQSLLLESVKDLPDETMAWLPSFGPCGGESSPLLFAATASLLRDHLTKQTDDSIYRSWLAVISTYNFLRKKYPKDIGPIGAIERMIQREFTNQLRGDAAALARKSKKPEQAPDAHLKPKP